MAHANHDQRRTCFRVPQFVDFRPTAPPVGLVPGPFAIINPYLSFCHPIPPAEVPLLNNAPFFAPFRYILNPMVLFRTEEERNRQLYQFMAKEELVPSQEEELRRTNAIEHLKKIVEEWVKEVAWKHRLSKNEIAMANSTILTYGSYGLGVHGSESDIDALCIGPVYATIADDFFIVLHDMLQSRPEVSEIHCVRNAKVPLMRFKFNGISIDLPYAQLSVTTISENMDLFNPFFFKRIDETSWRSLSGVRVNHRILQLVPNLENFQSMLRCVKLWAKRRGIYSHLLGFWGGIHLAILAAHVCQKYPNASVGSLIAIFFYTFSHWPWPMPVILHDGSIPFTEVPDGRNFMPILMPCNPYDWCNSNITRSTFNKIRAELFRGYSMTRDLARPDFEWSRLFDPFPYTKKYARFVRIFLIAADKDELRDWVGWVKSRFRALLLKLEELLGFCDPNPIEFVEHDVAEPNTVFYWGISPSRSGIIDVESIKEKFMKSIDNGNQSCSCKIDLTIVDSQQLPKSAHADSWSGNELGAWRFPEYNQLRRLDGSQHLLNSYVSGDGGFDHPNAGG